MTVESTLTAQSTSPAASAEAMTTEHTYNRRRRQRVLGKLTPVEFELAFTNQAAAVAA